MITTYDVYGDDIDGNRGELRTYYEVEESDRETIIEELKQLKEEYGELSEREFVMLYDDIHDDLVEVEVVVSDYI